MGNTPVWSTDRSRKYILRELRRAKDINPSLTYLRILLLDSLKSDAYTDAQLLGLSEDIAFLLKHHVDVLVGSRDIASQIDRDMYNYAILDDGTIMRAGENHVEWRIAHVSTSHVEYRRLLDNYKRMIDNSDRHLSFNASELQEHDTWRAHPNVWRQQLVDRLTEWMT
jgi:hypothetical protein